MGHDAHNNQGLLRQQAEEDIYAILRHMAACAQEETEPLWACIGLLIGLGLSLGLLFNAGKVPGLSGPGINSGLAALGALTGGGMLAGLCLLLVHVALWAVSAFLLARHVNRRHALRAEKEAAASLAALRERLRLAGGLFAEHCKLIDLLMRCPPLRDSRPKSGLARRFISPGE